RPAGGQYQAGLERAAVEGWRAAALSAALQGRRLPRQLGHVRRSDQQRLQRPAQLVQADRRQHDVLRTRLHQRSHPAWFTVSAPATTRGRNPTSLSPATRIGGWDVASANGTAAWSQMPTVCGSVKPAAIPRAPGGCKLEGGLARGLEECDQGWAGGELASSVGG